MCVYITTPDCDVQERQRAMILFSFVGSDYLQTCLVVHKKTRVLFFISLFQESFFCPPDCSLCPPLFVLKAVLGGGGKKARTKKMRLKKTSSRNKVRAREYRV